MSATDELRRMLDERGVEYFKHEEGEPLRELHEGRDDATSWRIDGANVCAVPFDDSTFDLWIDHATPKQAIAATLGAGTCHDKGGTDENGQQVFNCSECGCVLSLYDRDGTNTLCTGFIYDYPRYCPVCGRKVEG